MWEKISRGRVQHYSDAGFFVIKPESNVINIPFFCNVCNGRMKNAQDAEAYRKYTCCYNCRTKYAELNMEKWNKGWRPVLSK